MKLRSEKSYNSSFERPSTPLQDRVLKEPNTEERSRFIDHFQRKEENETFKDLCKQHGISRPTGYRWLKDYRDFHDTQRARKRKSKEKGTKLGRP